LISDNVNSCVNAPEVVIAFREEEVGGVSPKLPHMENAMLKIVTCVVKKKVGGVSYVGGVTRNNVVNKYFKNQPALN